MDVFVIKWLHIFSSTLLFGTGLGTAFFKFTTDLSGNLDAMAVVNRRVVLADWIFTTPTVLVQPLTGFALVSLYGYPMDAPWLLMSVVLYLFAGACWLPVVYLQIRMRDDSEAAVKAGGPLPPRYRRDTRLWFWLGVPAFIAMVAVLYLMTAKPALIF